VEARLSIDLERILRPFIHRTPLAIIAKMPLCGGRIMNGICGATHSLRLPG
jgi:hypothetical protein